MIFKINKDLNETAESCTKEGKSPVVEKFQLIFNN